MRSPAVLIGFWLVKIGIWCFLIWSSHRLGLHRRYPIPFAYIFAAILLEIVVYGAGVYSGIDSTLYSRVYFISYLTIFCLASWVVLRIYRIFGTVRTWTHLHLLVLPVVLVGLGIWESTPMSPDARVINIAASVLFYWGIATLIRMLKHREWELGWNLKMVLLAITMPFGFNSLVVMVSNAGVPLSYEAMTWWIKAGALTSWLVLAVGMIDYSPPRHRSQTGKPEAPDRQLRRDLPTRGSRARRTIVT